MLQTIEISWKSVSNAEAKCLAYHVPAVREMVCMEERLDIAGKFLYVSDWRDDKNSESTFRSASICTLLAPYDHLRTKGQYTVDVIPLLLTGAGQRTMKRRRNRVNRAKLARRTNPGEGLSGAQNQKVGMKIELPVPAHEY